MIALRRTSSGVALILVLMITGLLSLLILQISLTAKAHVDRSTRLLDRAKASLATHSGEAEVIFALLTQPWVVSDNEGVNPFTVRWNFQGVAFDVDDVSYRIQDLSGLLQLPSNADELGDFSRLLGTLGVADASVRQVEQEVVRVLGGSPLDGNTVGAPIQALQQLDLASTLSIEQIQRLESLTSVFPLPFFNPNTAPAEVITARFPGLAGESILLLRGQGTLDESTWQRASGGVDSDFLSFFPGPSFRIYVEASHGTATARREIVIRLRPNNFTPLELWSRRSSFVAGEDLP